MRVLTNWKDLQALVGITSEDTSLDFKETFDPSKGNKGGIELAKDVVALANVLGGHVLVGVSTEMNATRCTGFHGIDKDLAAKVTKVFEEQVRDRCRPTPVFNVRLIDLPNAPRVVVIVTVEPSPVAPIGVCLRQESGGHLVDKGWVFPYRVGSLTEYLHPDQFGVYESMSARRAAAFLNSIPTTERTSVNLRWVVGTVPTGSGYGDGQARHFESLTVKFDRVDLLGNVASFTELRGSGPERFGPPVSLPLDQIQTVWRKTKGRETSWEVSLIGSLHFDANEWQLWPPS
jgi:hypothetical protein